MVAVVFWTAMMSIISVVRQLPVPVPTRRSQLCIVPLEGVATFVAIAVAAVGVCTSCLVATAMPVVRLGIAVAAMTARARHGIFARHGNRRRSATIVTALCTNLIRTIHPVVLVTPA